MICIERNILTDFGEATRREWLETNGLGGYASTTLAGARTHGYHGLLVGGSPPGASPHVLLASLEEAVIRNGRRYEFSTQQYQNGTIHPQGYRYLERFQLDPIPVWTYCVEGFRFEKTIFMVHGENTVAIVYQPLSGEPVRFELRPLLAYRDYRQRQRENSAWQKNPTHSYDAETGLLEVTPYADRPPLRLLTRYAEFLSDGYWYRHFAYPADAGNPTGAQEDLYSYGAFAFNLDSLHPTAYLAVTTENYESINLERIIQMRRRELNRREQILNALPFNDVFLKRLALAADAFLIAAPSGKGVGILPGYPWSAPSDAGVQASLPGLLLATRRFDKAKAILGAYLDDLLPSGAPGEMGSHGAVSPAFLEGSLWLVYALFQYAHSTLDYDFIARRAYPILVEWMQRILQGRYTGWAVDASDRLLHTLSPQGPTHAGPDGSRIAVDMNALWYNALCIMARFAEQQAYPGDSDQFHTHARAVKESFRSTFWNDTAGYLYDSVTGQQKDALLRPYQLLAVSLPFDLLDLERARSVVEAVRTRLLTPYGVMARAPGECSPGTTRAPVTGYRADAHGDATILWPWLFGPFVTAYLKVFGRSNVRRRYLEDLLRPLRAHVRDAGVGTIPECFQISPSVAPAGCMAQARSVAELLRAGLLLATGDLE